MMKMKLCSVVLLILGACVIAPAAEVINVDLNGYNDNVPYVGNGAYDVGDDTAWTVYYGGWGEPVGSKRSEGLTKEVPPAEQWLSSVYAAQVWIGDDGQNHGYLWGSALLDDGFVANDTPDPKINLFGEGAYQGIYDIYVYGSQAGDFTLNYYGTPTTLSVDGDANEGQFELGHNYVVFNDVDINSANPADVNISYTNVINGLQLVKQKDPFVIEPNSLGLIRISAGNWDVAGERNTRTTEITYFGPDTFFDDVNGIGTLVGYLDTGEFMTYDIVVDEANEGRYDISLGYQNAPIYGDSMRIYVDDILIGEVNKPSTPIPLGSTAETDAETVNLYEGSHTVTWMLYAGETAMNIDYVKFTRVGDAANTNCKDVVRAGLTLGEDLNGDCVVDLEDLYTMVYGWLSCNNPDQSLCF
jgi:hypothetical protein